MIPWAIWVVSLSLSASHVSTQTTEGLLEDDIGEYMLVTTRRPRSDVTTVATTEEYGSGSGDDFFDTSTTNSIGSSSNDPIVAFTDTYVSDSMTGRPTSSVTDDTGPQIGSDTIVTDTMDDVTTTADVTTSTRESDMMIPTTSSDVYDDVTTAGDVEPSTAQSGDTDETINTSETPSVHASDTNEVSTTVGVTSADDSTATATILGAMSSTGGTVTDSGELNTLSSGVAPVAVITASTSTVPACSASFSLSGRHSYSDGSSIVRYAWTVTSDEVAEQLSLALETFNADDEGRGSPDINLSGDVLGSASALYAFTLTVTDENDLQGVTTFDLALSDESFTVSISSRIDINAFDRTQGLQLRALVHFFDGCEDTSGIQFAWSANMAKVHSALGITSNSYLSVPAKTISAATTVTFTVQACLASDGTVCASASQDVTTSLNDIDAVISGPSTRLVSVSSGDLSLDGSNSHDPSDLAGDLVDYSWRCGLITTGLFDELPGVGDALENTTSAILTINTDLLQPEVTYKCILTVSKGDRSATVETSIRTTALETVDVNLEIQGGSTSVHADELLVAKCYYTSTIDVAVTWSVTSSDGSEAISLNESSLAVPVQTQSRTSGISVTVMTLSADILTSGETYVVECKLTNQDRQDSGQSSVDVNVYSKPTGCMFDVSNYLALTEITLVTNGCSTTSAYSPLLYAYYYVKTSDGERHQLSLPSTDHAVTVIGPDATDVSNDVTFVVQVCDQVGSCNDFSFTASVRPVIMVTASEFTEFQREYVSDVALSGDSVTALQNLNSIVTTVRGTGSDAGLDDAAVAQLQVDLLTAALTETEGDGNVVEILVDGLGAISTPELEPEAQDVIADVITDLLSTADARPSPLSVPSLETILEKTQELHTQGVGQAKVSDIEEKALKLLSRNALAGGDPVKITTPDATYTAINKIPCGSIDLEESTASMNMGDEVCNMFSSWNCTDGSACVGVSIQTVIYGEGVDYVSSQGEGEAMASSVLKVGFDVPDTGEHIIVSNLNSEVTLSLRVSGGLGVNRMFTCKYWDASMNAWSTDGVRTVANSSSGNVQCLTSHFSAFVVTFEEITSTSVAGTVAVPDDSSTTIAPARTSPLRTVMLIFLGLFVLFLLIVFFIFSGILLFKHHEQKVIKTDHQIILKEMRTRREERSWPGSQSSTPRGKVSPTPPAEGSEGGEMGTVPPSYGMEDPKVAWIKLDQSVDTAKAVL